MSPRRLLAATLLLSVFAATAAAQRVLADLTGKWTMTVAGPQGANESAVVFKQDADSLSGNIESQMLGASKLSGMVKGDTIRFAFTVAIQGMPYELKASGAVKDKDNIAGSLEAPNGVATFPFTMKRVP
ncbi:MAG: hypothetical protein ABJB74_08860 [Gemmatimonas sp.]